MQSEKITKRQLVNLFENQPTRLDFLSEKQRVLVTLFINLQNFRLIAKILNVNEVTIARRLKKIADCISDNNFSTAFKNNSDVSRMKIAKDHFVNALPARSISKKRNLPYHKVRRIITELQTA